MKLLFSFIVSIITLLLSQAQSFTITIDTDSTFKDAIVETYDSNLNRGDDDIAYIQSWTNSGMNNKRYYFEFDFSTLPVNAIIDSAKLSFFNGGTATQNRAHQGANEWNIRRVTQAWSEDSITWKNQPGSTSQNKETIPATTSSFQDFPNIDITQLVTDAISYGNYGFVAELDNESPFRRIVFATSDNTIPASRPKLVLSYHMPCVVIPNYTYTSNQGNTINFINTSTASGTPTYHWDFGDGTFSTNSNPTKTYPVQGTYTVCLTIFNDCDTNTTCQTISTCKPAKCQIHYTANNNIIQFTALPANALTYQWDFGDGNYSNLQNPPYAYSANGQYNVCLTTTDSCGADTSCTTIDIHGIGLSENHELVFSIYPNPSSDIVNIEGDLSNVTQIELYTADGKKLCSLSPEQLPLRLSSYTKGSYFIKLQTKQGTQYHRLFKL